MIPYYRIVYFTITNLSQERSMQPLEWWPSWLSLAIWELLIGQIKRCTYQPTPTASPIQITQASSSLSCCILLVLILLYFMSINISVITAIITIMSLSILLVPVESDIRSMVIDLIDCLLHWNLLILPISFILVATHRVLPPSSEMSVGAINWTSWGNTLKGGGDLQVLRQGRG